MTRSRYDLRPTSERGSIIIIVMVLTLVFLILGSALFLLIRSSNSATDLERKDVKAFNVAEAGVDATMVALKADWPRYDEPRSQVDSVSVDPVAFRSVYTDSTQFPDPKTGQFISAVTYDNTPDNPTSDESKRVYYDKNHDDVMWIDAEADVGDDRHRILVMVERLSLAIQIPDVALIADTAGGNSHGLQVDLDPAYHGSIPDGGAPVVYTGQGDFHSGVNAGANINVITLPTNPFDDFIPQSLIGKLKQMAQAAGSFFEGNDASDMAGAYLSSSVTGPGSVVYVESSEEPITIAGTADMGSPEKPAILVIDTLNSGVGIDWRGTAKFYGVVIVVGDVLLRGTMDIAGAVMSNGAVENKGGPGIRYNGDYIRRLNDQYTLSVALVPNTWEEYTIPKD